MPLGIGTGIGLQRFFIGSGGGGNNTPAQYGAIFSNDFTTLANLNNYTASTPASTWQLTGGYLRVTQVPGAASFNDWLRYNAWGDTQLEDYTLTTRFIPRDILTGNSGIGIGIKSTNTFGATQNVYAVMRTDSTASGGKVIIYFDGTNKAITTTAITWTTGDTIEVKLYRNKFSYTGSVQNITSGSTIQTCVWNSDFTGSNDSQRIGRPALIHLGGTHDVISMSYNVSTYKYATFAFIGDSITHGNNSLIDTNNTWRFANIATMGLDPNLTTVYASSNNTTQEIINNLPEITSFRPTNVVLMIGGNDVELSVAMNTYRNNYTTIRNSLVASGATVFHCLATPRNATNMAILNNWILSSFTSDTIINTYNTIVSGAGTGILAKYDADGTHPNWLGHVRLGQEIYSAISSAYTYTYADNSTTLFSRLSESLNTYNKFTYDFLMRKLTNESIYNELEFLRIFAQANTSDALLNLVSTSFTATISGSPTFSAYTHYKFNGTSDAIDMGFNVANGTKLLQNSASLGVYVVTNGASGEGCDLGAFQSTNSRTHIFARYTTGTKMSLAPNSTAPTDDNTKGPGFYQTKRVTSGATTHSVRSNTVNYSASSSDVSVTRPSVTLSVGARNRQSGGAINFSDRPVAAAYAGSGNIDMEKMFKIVHGFMDINTIRYSDEAEALFSAMIPQPNTARKELINNLIVTLKADGNWNKLDALWITAAHTQQAALLNWKNPATFTATTVNSPTFTTDRGFSGDGLTSYLDLNWNPSGNGVNFRLSADSFGFYSRTDASGTMYDMGTESASPTTDGCSMALKWNDNNIYARNNGDIALSTTVVNTQGLFANVRRTASKVDVWRNTTKILDDQTQIAAGVSVLDFYLGALNSNGVASAHSTREYSMGFVGGGDINMTTFYNAIQSYMTSIGAQV